MAVVKWVEEPDRAPNEVVKELFKSTDSLFQIAPRMQLVKHFRAEGFCSERKQ